MAAPQLASNEITLHLLGPVELRSAGRALPLSSKAATLLTYLALEKRPVHREEAARLLWPEGNGLQNLRVELTVLRRLGLDLSPKRSPLLTLPEGTKVDADGWFEAAESKTARAQLLGGLRGIPLSSLKELGIGETDHWVTQQRKRLCQHLRTTLTQWRGEAEAVADHAQVRTLERHLRALGAEAPTPAQDQPFAWLAASVRDDWNAVLAQAQRSPRLLLYSGRHASGRRRTLHQLTGASAHLSIEIDATKKPQVLLASLAFQLLHALPAPLNKQAQILLTSPTTPENDLIRLGLLLSDYGQPVIVTIHNADTGSRSLIALLDFILGLPLPLLVVAVTLTQRLDAVKQVLRQHLHPDRFSVLLGPALTPAALQHVMPALTAGQAYEIIRQSEGWWPSAAHLLAQHIGPGPLRLSGVRTPLSSELISLLTAELSLVMPDQTPLLATLASLPSPFTEESAAEALRGQVSAEAAQELLHCALNTQVLERVPATLAVTLPGWTVRRPDGLHPLRFCSELQRAALAATLDGSQRTQLRQLAPVAQPPQPLPPAQLLPCTASSVTQQDKASGPQRLLDLGGGYQAVQYTLLHLGAQGHDVPVLQLHHSAPEHSVSPHWHWQVRFCVALFTGLPHHFPLRLEVQNGAETATFTPEWQPGTWLLAEGISTAPALTLKVQASDLTLHLAEVTFTPLP